MSGSGGGGGGGGGVSPSDIECSRLFIRTTLNSPNPKVVKGLSKGDKLKVELTAEEGPVLVMTDSGETVGSITGRELLDLIRCLNEGYDYAAFVLEVTGGQVKVEIRPISK
jgi:hypothetical protein